MNFLLRDGMSLGSDRRDWGRFSMFRVVPYVERCSLR